MAHKIKIVLKPVSAPIYLQWLDGLTMPLILHWAPKTWNVDDLCWIPVLLRFGVGGLSCSNCLASAVDGWNGV